MKYESFGCETGRLYYLSAAHSCCLRQVMLNIACSKSGVNDRLMTGKRRGCCERKTSSDRTCEAYFYVRFLVEQVYYITITIIVIIIIIGSSGLIIE